MGILEEIRKRKVFCDGGMGSLLQARGLKPGELPETWNVLHPEILKEVHLGLKVIYLRYILQIRVKQLLELNFGMMK